MVVPILKPLSVTTALPLLLIVAETSNEASVPLVAIVETKDKSENNGTVVFNPGVAVWTTVVEIIIFVPAFVYPLGAAIVNLAILFVSVLTLKYVKLVSAPAFGTAFTYSTDCNEPAFINGAVISPSWATAKSDIVTFADVNSPVSKAFNSLIFPEVDVS